MSVKVIESAYDYFDSDGNELYDNEGNEREYIHLTDYSRDVAEKIVLKTLKEDLGGVLWDYDDDCTWTYEFSSKISKKKILDSVCNALKDTKYKAWITNSNMHIQIDDPDDYYRGMEIAVYKDPYNDAPGKKFFCVDIMNIY